MNDDRLRGYDTQKVGVDRYLLLTPAGEHTADGWVIEKDAHSGMWRATPEAAPFGNPPFLVGATFDDAVRKAIDACEGGGSR